MRDLLLMSIVLALCAVSIRKPWVGAVTWAWLSLMSPHRYTYGFALNAPITMMAAAATLMGLAFAKEKWNPFQASPVTWFALFTLWLTISWIMGYSPSDDYEQWKKIMKINFMILVTLALLRSAVHINVFFVVCALSLALLGAKGGVFTVLTGGGYKVWGPPGSFVEDNNEFALALVMVIPLLRYAQMQSEGILKHVFLVIMLLCAAAVFGSHSRGALLAGVAMGTLLWWRGSRNRLTGALAILPVFLVGLYFMPEEWFARMETIRTFDEDDSALGRLSAWSMAWNSAFHHFFGLGLNAARSEWFEMYSSYGLQHGTPVAHSIYFQTLGHHGFIGLFLFVGIWISTWRTAASLRNDARNVPEAAWCGTMGSLIQVSLIGYLVGGAFLSLAYFDLPYNIMVAAVATRSWLNRKAWKQEPALPVWRWGMWRKPKPKVTTGRVMR